MIWQGEEVKWIMGFENEYGATRSGKIISYKCSKAKELKGSISSYGYRYVTLNYKPYAWHRIIALTFIPSDDTTLTIDHINEDKLDNCVDNLRWCTLSENIKFYTSNVERKVKRLQRKEEKEKIRKARYVSYLKSIGTKVYINGRQFNSIHAAVRFILDQERSRGNERKEDTVRKEVRKMVQGKRKPWCMYGLYNIDTIFNNS